MIIFETKSAGVSENRPIREIAMMFTCEGNLLYQLISFIHNASVLSV